MSKYRLSAAILSAALIVGGLYFYEPPKPPPPVSKQNDSIEKEVEKPQGVGIVEVSQIISRHPDGETLDELRGREIRLRLELKEVLRPIIPKTFPEIDEKPFEDSARERLMQDFISKMSDLKAKEILLIEKYRAETEPEYLKKRDAIRDFYVNEALNVTLKLQNADNLYLSKEEFDKLQARLEEIVAERNQRQAEMREEWIQQINSKVEAEISAEQERIKAEYEASYKKSEEEAAQHVRAVQERNQALMEAAREIEYRQNRRREILDELNDTSKQIFELENKIFDSIISESSKLAAVLKLQMIFVKDDEEIQPDGYSVPIKLNSANIRLNSKTVVFATGGITDLTNDVIKSMQLKGILK